MAEVYGEKPKIFTKEWWPYYWMYYKWHTVAVLFVAMLVIMSLVQCINKETYDLKITTLGQFYYKDGVWDVVEKELEKDIKDADKDGEKHVDILSLTVFPDNKEYAQQDLAEYLKHDGGFSNNLMYLYIYDKRELETRMESGFIEEGFIKTESWLKEKVADDKLVYDKAGNAYAVSLKDSTILKKAGIDGENLYVLVRTDQYIRNKNKTAHNNAVIAANKLIK